MAINLLPLGILGAIENNGIITFGLETTASMLAQDLMDDWKMSFPQGEPVPEGAVLLIKSLTRL